MANNSSILTPEEKIRNLQRTLYRQAKGNPKWKAWSLYSDLCWRDLLKIALNQVLANRGAPGVDGVSVEPLKASAQEREIFLDQLQLALKEKRYTVDPVRRVYIPKANGKQRPLGIPTVKDRVVQTAVKLLLEPIFEADFHPNSFAYRPRKCAQQAIKAIKQTLVSGRTEVVDADLSKYFDTIPHRELLRHLRRRVSDGSILKLVKAWLRAPIVEENSESGKKRKLPNKRGTPQGGVISPLLANIYLNDLDHQVNDQCELRPIMVRYADDLVILCRKGRGSRLKDRLKKYLKIKGLELNEQKTKIVNSEEEGFTFVGFRFNWRQSFRSGKRYPHVEASRESQKTLRENVGNILNHWTLHRKVEDVVEEINRKVRGWTEYFHYGNSSKVFGVTQWWLDNRMRRWLWRKQKCKGGVWSTYTKEKTINEYGLYQLPLWIKY